ncbi:16264_t:CDS:2 [Racocetra fulgida]|uniref:16264_t:CDS:1 n=1 Tax=Racocetra fulgida TaxID=60492 RepID=A0A9N9D1I3_9GLOM|nr:16264_t:CDS:2 [Racocetra fulgida]
MSNTYSNIQKIPSSVSSSDIDLISDQDKGQDYKDKVYENDEDSNSDLKVIEKSEQNKQKKKKKIETTI